MSDAGQGCEMTPMLTIPLYEAVSIFDSIADGIGEALTAMDEGRDPREPLTALRQAVTARSNSMTIAGFKALDAGTTGA